MRVEPVAFEGDEEITGTDLARVRGDAAVLARMSDWDSESGRPRRPASQWANRTAQASDAGLAL